MISHFINWQKYKTMASFCRVNDLSNKEKSIFALEMQNPRILASSPKLSSFPLALGCFENGGTRYTLGFNVVCSLPRFT